MDMQPTIECMLKPKNLFDFKQEEQISLTLLTFVNSIYKIFRVLKLFVTSCNCINSWEMY